MQAEHASFAGKALNGHIAAMGLGDVFDDGKAKSCAAQLPASCLIDPVKPLT